MRLDGIKAPTFDTFGTVVDWRTSVIDDFRAFGQRKGIDIDWDAFVDEWKTCYRPGMDEVRSGKSPWRTVDFIYRVKLDEILPKSEGNMNALRALAPPPLRPVPRPSRPQPRTPTPRWSRRHSAHQPPGAPTAPARL